MAFQYEFSRLSFNDCVYVYCWSNLCRMANSRLENVANLCEVGVNAYYLLLSLQEEDLHNRCRRRWWVRPIIMRRKRLGFCETLVREMEFRDPDWYFAFTRMNYDQFEWIFNKLSPFLMKQYVIREPLSPKLRLFITIR